jgi:hypothetical protein
VGRVPAVKLRQHARDVSSDELLRKSERGGDLRHTIAARDGGQDREFKPIEPVPGRLVGADERGT